MKVSPEILIDTGTKIGSEMSSYNIVVSYIGYVK